MSRKQSPDGPVIRLDEYRNSKRKTLTDMEQVIERAKQDAAERAMTALLAVLGPEDGSPKPCPRCHTDVPVHTHQVGRHITALHGTHTLMRAYHFCRSCRLGFCPRDVQLGLPADGALSLEL